MNDQVTAFRADPIDVSDLTLSQLEDLPQSSIAIALREVLDPARGEIAAAGFDAFTPAISHG